MTEQDAVEMISVLDENDYERSHGIADDILISFLRENGFNKIADAYTEASERIGFLTT